MPGTGSPRYQRLRRQSSKWPPRPRGTNLAKHGGLHGPRSFSIPKRSCSRSPRVADLAYARFTPDELDRVATWMNGTLDNWNDKNLTYWPFDDPRNNDWQNGFLAMSIGGI